MAQIITATDIFIIPPPMPCIPLAPLMGTINVTNNPGTLTAMGNAVAGEDDIKDSIEVLMGIPYMAPPYVIPGVGNVIFESGETPATKLTDSGDFVMIQSGPGNWKFEVVVAAMMPPLASTPDPTLEYPGTFNIITVQPVATSI